MTLYIMHFSINSSPAYFIKRVFISGLLIVLSGCDGAAEIPKQPMRTVRVETVSANNR